MRISLALSNRGRQSSWQRFCIIDLDIRRAKDNVVENRDFIIEEITAYIKKQFTDLSYDKNEFDTITTKLIRGIAYSVALGSNFHI